MVITLIVHHNNTHFVMSRHGDRGSPLSYSLPEGPLVKLLLAHIHEGHKLLTQQRGSHAITLFVSNHGHTFTGSTFTQYWKNLMGSIDTNGMRYYPPNDFRTSFIVEFVKVSERNSK